MRLQLLPTGLATAALALLAGPLAADTIYLLDGKSLEDVSVGEENLKEIEYKEGSKRSTVKTDDVLRIEYSAKSSLVDRADTAAAEGQLLDAIADLQTYVDGMLESGRTPRYKWEPAYAMQRLVELHMQVGDAPGLIAAADKLIENAPESRHVPTAFLAKAEAQYFTGQAKAAVKTLDALKAVVQSQNLSQRWALEQELASLVYDESVKGKTLRDRLDGISTKAGSQFPRVKNRAEVAIAESFVSAKSFGEAEPIFRDVVENPKADATTLAAAYTGLGDCLFKRAVEEGDAKKKDALMTEAAMAYMRVVVVYKDQNRYVPKALFWAGRVFDESQDPEDKERAQKLYLRVMRDFQGTEWASEASSFRKR
jgi:tetratricopeptide (TPR) repeat protein